MTSYEARLRLGGESAEPIRVEVDLTDDRVVVTSGDVDIADWAKDELRVSALPDGFHVRAEGEDVVLEVEDEARFAVELGLRNAHPALRQKMSKLLREER